MGLLMHQPVMCKQAREWLSPQPGEIIVDCTVGGGGHASEICNCLKGKGKFIGIDQDKDGLGQARKVLREFGSLVSLRCDNFKELDVVLDSLNVGLVDGILFDLGVSSFQLEAPERGFSFLHEGPLDMRMDQSQGITAAEIVNNLPEEKIAHILKDFGEERWAWRIARAIVQRRKRFSIATTRELVEVILSAVPNRFGKSRIHPATRTFQAIRIAVNNELEALKIALEKSLERLSAGGRIVVISFHSLEDRIVKNIFRDSLRQEKVIVLTKKPIGPDEEELQLNPRSRSAKLRAAQKI